MKDTRPSFFGPSHSMLGWLWVGFLGFMALTGVMWLVFVLPVMIYAKMTGHGEFWRIIMTRRISDYVLKVACGAFLVYALLYHYEQYCLIGTR